MLSANLSKDLAQGHLLAKCPWAIKIIRSNHYNITQHINDIEKGPKLKPVSLGTLACIQAKAR